MRTSLVIFGVIFLVLGILLYLIPMQQIKADTTTSGNGNVDTRSSTARVTVPIEWAFALAIIGLVLFILGIAIPGPNKRGDSRKDSYEKVSKENIKVGDGNKRKIIRETTERQR